MAKIVKVIYGKRNRIKSFSVIIHNAMIIKFHNIQLIIFRQTDTIIWSWAVLFFVKEYFQYTKDLNEKHMMSTGVTNTAVLPRFGKPIEIDILKIS